MTGSACHELNLCCFYCRGALFGVKYLRFFKEISGLGYSNKIIIDPVDGSNNKEAGGIFIDIEGKTIEQVRLGLERSTQLLACGSEGLHLETLKILGSGGS